jgi:D-3-phosphoglycerate dehydrogenase
MTPKETSSGVCAPRTNSAIERRVLITTVPFGNVNRRPLDLLEEAGVEYVINPIGRRLKEDELVKIIGDFGVVIAGTEPISAKVIEAAPHLRLISRVGIGLDSVNLTATRAHDVLVSYTPDAPSPAVAELTIGLMLALLRDITGADRKIRNGVWHRFMGQRLSERTVGVIGVGRIGKRVIQHLVGGFHGVRILANDIEPDLEFGHTHGVRWVAKETIYSEGDLISLHLPLTSMTRQLITRREMAKMRPGTVLINTSRGNMIDECDLAKALRANLLGGAAIDVFRSEPYSGELTTLENCILTCHMGSMSRDCRYRMELEATEEVIRFLRNEPLEQLVPETEYPMP